MGRTTERTLDQYKVDPVTKYEDWVVSRWRPAVGWSYIAICLFDFIIAPTGRMLFTYYAQIDFIPWTSLTLEAGGMFHMAMGAILGVAAWTRGQEKMSRIEHWGNDLMDDDAPADATGGNTRRRRLDQVPEDFPTTGN